MKLGLVAVVFAALVVLCDAAHGHGGGLNSEGCHRETKTGGYHCHRSGSSGDDKDRTAAVVAGVVVVAGVLWMIGSLADESSLHVEPYAEAQGTRGGLELRPSAHRAGLGVRIGASESSVGRGGHVGLVFRF